MTSLFGIRRFNTVSRNGRAALILLFVATTVAVDGHLVSAQGLDTVVSDSPLTSAELPGVVVYNDDFESNSLMSAHVVNETAPYRPEPGFFQLGPVPVTTAPTPQFTQSVVPLVPAPVALSAPQPQKVEPAMQPAAPLATPVMNAKGKVHFVVQTQTFDPPLPDDETTNTSADTSAAASGASQFSSQSGTLGQAPADTNYAFLRRVSPLLQEGEVQYDVGLIYSLFDNDLPFLIDLVPDPDTVVEGRLRNRQLTVPFAIRYGLSDETQFFINIPVSWAHGELSLPGFDTFAEEFGVGDITLGLTCLLNEACPGEPDLIGTIALTTPTGNSVFSSTAQQPGVGVGGGHFALSGDLLAIHTVDPLVVFYGTGIRAPFADRFDGGTFNVQPGLEFNYRFGVGFAVNDKVTLSSSVIGSYITDIEINGQRLANSTLEPIVLRLATTIADGDCIKEPFVQIGMTDDASSVTLGWIVTY